MMKKLLALLLLLMLVFPALAEGKDNRYDAIGDCGFDENTLLPVKRDGMWGFVNASGELVIPCEWEDYRAPNAGKIAVQKDGLWGCIDLAGNVLVEPEWEHLSVWSDGSYDVVREGGCALMNAEGELVTALGEYNYVGWNIDGMLMITAEGDRVGKLDLDGNPVIPAEWDYIGYFHDDRAYATSPAFWDYVYIDRTGAVVIPGPFDEAYDFDSGVAAVRLTSSPVVNDSTRDWNFIDVQGNVLFDEGFRMIQRLSDGMYTVSRDGKIGYVSASGELVIPIMYEVFAAGAIERNGTSDFSHGRAAVRLNGEGFWIDEEGNRLADLPYAAVGDWSGSLAFVRPKNGLWGAIDAQGEVIIPCEWESLGGKWSTPHDKCEIVRAVRGSEMTWFSQQGQNITGRVHDLETTTAWFDWHHLYLLEDGVLTIWNAEGEQVY